MSHIVRKPDFCLCENKGADQLHSNCEDDQHFCFRYTDSTISLLLKSEISSFCDCIGRFVSDLVGNPEDRFFSASRLRAVTNVVRTCGPTQLYYGFCNKICLNYMSRIVRKREFCLCENKGADQLRGNREADQRLCFRYTDSTISLLLKSEISSF